MSKKDKDPWVRIINVSDTIRHEKGYTLYKITSKVFPKNSVEATSEVTVWKRYNDFKKLYKALYVMHQSLYLKDKFPAFAKSRIFGRFDNTVIEERRLSAEAILQFAAKHPPLFTSQIFVKFFESSHIVHIPESVEKIAEPVLLPLPSKFTSDSNHLCIPQDSLKSDSKEACFLGGTWQHLQGSDNMSFGSQQTDEEDEDDDKTTFTDDDSVVSRPSLNLSEFDPLCELNSAEHRNGNNNELCNNWLISALQSCSNLYAEKECENPIEFPAPFEDLEIIDNTSAFPKEYQPNNNLVDSKTKGNINQETSERSPNTIKDISEFDPLVNKDGNVRVTNDEDNDDDVSNYDRFAMTPSSVGDEYLPRPAYIIHAAHFVSAAQDAEVASDFANAFDCYKKAIDTLLQGSKSEGCSVLRDAVRKKVLLYLMRAEEIYENKLPKLKSSPQKNNQSNISRSSKSQESKILNFKGCLKDLNRYKVLGVLGRVLLVLDITKDTTYVVKALYKSSAPKNPSGSNIIPQNIPYVVRLCQVYETSYAVFLIIEHAKGGRLWDYVSSYLNRSPISPTNDCSFTYKDGKHRTVLSNAYSGKKVADSTSDTKETLSINDSELKASQNCPLSYVALFKKYATTADQDETVALAKYYSASTNAKDSSSVSQKEAGETDEVLNKQTKREGLQQKNTRNRLSSSTGSIETVLSQKTHILDVFGGMDEAMFLTSSSQLPHLPESCICVWTAEIVIAIEALHKLGIIWMDLHPDNILLGAEGHVLLTYRSQWNCVDHVISSKAKENFYCAPEVGNVFPVTAACDWWSLGAMLFELLTGRSLVSCHPTGITDHTLLNLPDDVSAEAKDFLNKLLQHNPNERLGSGVYGVEEIKSHPFFRTIDWSSLCHS